MQAGTVATLSNETERFMQDFYFRYLCDWATALPNETEWTVWAQIYSENHDSSRRVARYFAAQTLAKDPIYAQSMLPNHKTVAEECDAWEAWWYDWPNPCT